MKCIKITLFQVLVLCFCSIHAEGQDGSFNVPVIANQDLPSGVPRIVETNGTVLFIDTRFTTPAFENEGLRLVIEEANRVASDLHLAEDLPITGSNLTHAYISPFGYTYKTKKLGNITTSNYWYGIEQNYKFSDLTIADYDKHLVNYRAKYFLPVSQMDTNAAYQLATQWLSAVHMDVAGLNRDCNVRIALSSDLDGTERPRGKFTPLYYVVWTPRVKINRYDRGASVQLFLPTKTLLQLSVSSERYILRPPVTFANLAALFPGKATITTNQLAPIKEMDASQQFPIVTPKWPKNPPSQ